MTPPFVQIFRSSPLAKRRQFAFAFIMAAIMTSVITGVLAFVAGGNADFMGRWLKSFGLAFALAIPIIYFAAPRVRAYVERHIG